jgi:hypothetical protein
MEEAEQAAARAAAAAASSGHPPPVEAYGALIRGYYRLKDLPPLMAAFQKFLRMGGRPNCKMANAVVRLSLLKGQLNTALQAIRVMRLLDVDMDTEQYRTWVMQLQRRQPSSQLASRRDSRSITCGQDLGGVGFSSGKPVQSTKRDGEGNGVVSPRYRQQKPTSDYRSTSMYSSDPAGQVCVGNEGTHIGTSAGSSTDGLERLKWFLGLPNNYYESSWK